MIPKRVPCSHTKAMQKTQKHNPIVINTNFHDDGYS